jgi:hypothetical protein
MRKLIAFCLLSNVFVGFSQGNLQFNQVITRAGSTQGNLSLGTVPIGKVWKIEARSTDINQILTYINGFRYDYIFGNNAGLVMNDQPIWLKAGDVLSISTNPGCCIDRDYFFSIIEFNIVQ